MARRNRPLITGEIYHVINRGVAHQYVFLEDQDYRHAIEIMFYYQYRKPSLRYSFYKRLPDKDKVEFLKKLKKENSPWVDIVAYCLMPNHIHLLVKQLQDNGISHFMRILTDSYARYFNIKGKRAGPLFQGRFKYVRVETDEQLWHLSRYIHLNPYSAYLMKSKEKIKEYPYSSFSEYITKKGEHCRCQKQIVLDNFKGKFSYESFVLDRADHQQQLQNIKHLIMENSAI